MCSVRTLVVLGGGSPGATSIDRLDTRRGGTGSVTGNPGGRRMDTARSRPAIAGPGIVGREDELRTLDQALDRSSSAAVVFLHGIAGIGKSTLLAAWAAAAGSRGVRVVRVDARLVEPTEAGFTAAIGSAWTAADPGDDAQLVIAVDNAEVIRLLDTWLRQSFVPALPSGIRLLISGREPPVAAWLTAQSLESRVRVLHLDRLDELAARDLLLRLGVPDARAPELARVARGHPLAVRLVAATLAERPDLEIDDLAAHRLVGELARLFLSEVRDAGTRRALLAGSVVRRLTHGLLTAMDPEATAEDLDRLAQVPFVESRHDGLVVHEAVREPVSRHLRATDPTRYRRYRRAVYRRLTADAGTAPPADLWRYTADLLFMIENPVVREAFFPSGAQPLAVEPAPPDALPAIEQITLRHDGPASAALVRAWWHHARGSFSVVRDRNGEVVGWFQLFRTGSFRSRTPEGDPVVDAWRRHLLEHPVPRGQEVLGFRRWLALDAGEAPGPCQAASWLDVKRTYLAMRPGLRRIYTVVRDVGTYWPVVEPLGFRPLPDQGARAGLDGHEYTSVVLDFGPRSVDGWLAGLLRTELGVAAWELDESANEVRVEDRRISLTPLEFGVLAALARVPGRTVRRREIVAAVWGWDAEAGSNVLEAVIRRLRRKLGAVPCIETVRGSGYRLRDD
jgi:hypothetical protein